MEKIDARKHSPATQYEIRKQVIRLREKGLSNRDVAQGVGISESHASTIWQRYRKGGSQAIRLGRRGRRTGEKRSLTEAQEAGIQRLMIDKTPDQFKLAFALWTREAVQLLIKKLYRLEMPIRTVGAYLQRWGFTPQKPIKRAYEQNPQAVKRWLETEYPILMVRAKKEKAVIHWGDETGLQTDAYRVRGFAPQGKTPVVRLPAKKSSVNMISVITNQGLVRFMMYRENMTSQLLIKFMSRLVKDTDQKVFLILDNLRSHHSKKVKQWLEEHQKEIRVFYLPSYAPDLNPDEYLNGDLKGRIHSGQPARSQNDLEYKTRSFMRKLQKRPEHVRSYFRHPMVKYAA
jgi:transposase